MKIPAVLFFSMAFLPLPLLAQDRPTKTTLESGAERPALIELFSSEGCSSCPPAEEWLSAWKGQAALWKQVVPVAFHVDYWDNLGWPDKFASKTYTDRQRAYATRWNSESVYTPEMVLNGQEWQEWHGTTPGQQINFAPADAGKLKVEVQSDAKQTAVVTYSGKIEPGYRVYVAWLGLGVTSDVRAGENEGRNLTHDFVVVDFQEQKASDGALTFKGANSNRPAVAKAIAVWVADGDGRIVQVLGGDLATAN